MKLNFHQEKIMSKKKPKLYKCPCCKEKLATIKGCVCFDCGEDLERDCLTEMYGEEDGNYFADIGFFPGDN